MGLNLLTVSSKGQIVLPAAIRKELHINSGDKLAVYSEGDIIMLKPIHMPTKDTFLSMLDRAQEWAASVGYSEQDVNDIIKESRSRKK